MEKEIVWTDGSVQYGRISGRTTYAGEPRNPLTWLVWIFKNDMEPLPPPFYMPDSPQWWRVTSWYFRNPMQNLGSFVLGVRDKNYDLKGNRPLWVTTLADINQLGWKWSIIYYGWMRLPFVSYSGKHVVWYAGWQWWGFFGFKFNVR